VLWSIAAGPLVNVALYPLLHFAMYATGGHGWIIVSDDARRLITNIWGINLGLLVFNILPFYPLDGGQIVRALLWFKVGPIRSLLIAAIIGICGAICLGALALYFGLIWTIVIAFFLGSQAMAAIQHARAMQAEADATPPPIPTEHKRE
jgi:Zn-dependent protease